MVKNLPPFYLPSAKLTEKKTVKFLKCVTLAVESVFGTGVLLGEAVSIWFVSIFPKWEEAEMIG